MKRQEMFVKMLKTRAAKYYLCDECGKPIQPGEKYTRIAVTGLKGEGWIRTTSTYCFRHNVKLGAVIKER